MFTIYDYLDYYKNCSFEEVGFNQIDAMLFACLVYLPIKSFRGDKSYKDFISYGKTERLCVDKAVSIAEGYGFKSIDNYKELKAGEIVKTAAAVTKGGGGGRDDFAQAGGKDLEKVDEALSTVKEFIEGKL